MKIGDRVKIYQDPVSEHDYEGVGTLIKKGEGNSGLSKGWGNYYVRFEDSKRDMDILYHRTIREKNIIK